MLRLNHKKLDVWIKGMDLVSEIYRITKSFPKEEIYGITSQIRRSAVSIVSNISEGASRKSQTERKRFYEISRSSLVELDTQIEISKNLNYINEIEQQKLSQLMNHVFAMISNLIKML